MFIKLPSGRIFNTDSIVGAHWENKETTYPAYYSVVTSRGVFSLRREDARAMSDYLDSIAANIAEEVE